MFYTFPDNLTLNETREVIARHNAALGVEAFIEADRGEHIIFNYIVSFAGSFPELTGDPVRDREIGIIRECRGLVFDKANGKVVSRRFHKFHNLGERADTQPHTIDWSFPHDVLLKRDGSMITLLKCDGRWEAFTKMGRTDVAVPVTEFVSRNPVYTEFAEHCLEHDVTAIYEWCSRKQKIVIDYPVDELVLLAVRDNHTGVYHRYTELANLTEAFSIPLVERIEGSVTDVNVLIEQVNALQNQEGFIIRFHNGHMLKVKNADYIRLHGMIDVLQREKDVLSLVLSGSLDDAKPLMSEDSRERVEAYLEAVERGVAVKAAALKEYADRAIAAVGDDRKRLALEWVNIDSVSGRDRPFLFRIAAGADPVATVLDCVRKNCGTSTKVEEIRDLIGGVRWDDFRDRDAVVDND